MCAEHVAALLHVQEKVHKILHMQKKEVHLCRKLCMQRTFVLKFLHLQKSKCIFAKDIACALESAQVH